MLKKTTAKSLIARLGIVQQNILNEAAEMPTYFAEAAVYRVDKMRRRTAAEMELSAYRASLSQKIRRRKASDAKLTENGIKELVYGDQHVAVLQAQVYHAEAQEELSRLLLDALKMRRDSIRIIADAAVYENMREDKEVTRIQQRTKLREKARELEERRRAIE
jgi:hypothetical protein